MFFLILNLIQWSPHIVWISAVLAAGIFSLLCLAQYSKKDADSTHAIVVVIGSVSHSPRMVYHARSLSKLYTTVDIIGLKSNRPLPNFPTNVHVRPLFSPEIPIGSFLVRAAIRYLILTFALMYALVSGTGADVVLCQVPPAVPTLPILKWYTATVGAALVVDWHNTSTSLLRHANRPPRLVQVMDKVETFFGRMANSAFTVSDYFAKQLNTNGQASGVPLKVLRDCPPPIFQPRPREEAVESLSTVRWGGAVDPKFGAEGSARPPLITVATSYTPDEDMGVLLDALASLDRALVAAHGVSVEVAGDDGRWVMVQQTPMTKGGDPSDPTASPLAPAVSGAVTGDKSETEDGSITPASSPPKDAERAGASLQGRAEGSGPQEPSMSSGVDSSSLPHGASFTSSKWKSVGGDGVEKVDSARLPRHVYVLVTGDGPGRAAFEKEVAAARFVRVCVATHFFPSLEEYATALSAADLSISLHTSTSGGDLPMKAVDALGAGVPVAAFQFPALGELVRSGENGVTFNSAATLSGVLLKLLSEWPEAQMLSALRKGAAVRREGWSVWAHNAVL